MIIIGRKEEKQEMQSYLNDKNGHLIALIGRRRVGKTFLVREVYRENIVFEMTGLKDGTLNKQLINFTLQLNHYIPKDESYNKPKDWLRAFNLLSKAIDKLNLKNKPVVFLDEVPWIAGKRSGFKEALGHWWNNWASKQNIIVVICGSAASWMIDNIINAKGGLHNRLTKQITLLPFTLLETKLFLENKNIKVSLYQIIQLYLSIGGIPHYLNQIKKGKSVAQNIKDICFSKDGVLYNEFDNLYSALFDKANNHISIIKALAKKSKGLARQELLHLTRMKDGGHFSKILKELETSGFISTFQPLENKKKNTLYRLTDEYSLFYLHFMDGKSKSNNIDWIGMSQKQEYKIWCGYAFENLCIKHVDKIKAALGVTGVQTSVNSFLHKKNEKYEKGFQIDMLLDRNDNVMNICEMKFYADEFSITKEYAKKIRTKREGLKMVTKTKKMVYVTFVTTYGVFDNQYKTDIVDNDFTLDIFFA